MHELTYVAIEPTNRCNLQCKMCFSHTSGRAKGDMSLANFERIVAELATIPTVRFVSVNVGGEPLLHPEFERMLELIAGHGWITGFSTNGMLLTPRICKKIITTDVGRVDVGLDATGPKVEAIRVGMNYQTVKRNILTLLAMRNTTNSRCPEVGINCAFTDDHKLVDAMSLLTEMGPHVDMIRILPAINEDMTFQQENLFDPVHLNNHCPSPDGYAGILWNGDVVPCCKDISAKTVMGNAFEEGVLGVFNNQRYTSLREASHERFEGECIQELKRCFRCQIWKKTMGLKYEP